MCHQLFGNSHDVYVPWAFVSNVISEMFLRATHQNASYSEVLPPQKADRPLRALSQEDISFLHVQKLHGKNEASRVDVLEFWEWFGPICQEYHHNHFLRTLFLRGLIFGLISKEDCVNVFGGMEPGAFLIRNSESSRCGEFAIAFVDSLRHVRHYKINQKKLKPPYGNLADFVREKEQLKRVVTSSQLEGAVNVTNKMEAFAEFFSKQDEASDEQYTSHIY